MAIIKIRNAAIDLDAAEIPNLPATKITSGTFDNARISLDAAEIPNLDTAKITTATLADARIPANALNSNIDLTNLSASNLTSGTIPTARITALPAGVGGKVLQVVSVATTTQSSSSSSTFADVTNLTAAITPSSSSNKILVTVFCNGVGKETNNAYVGLRLLRGSSVIAGLDYLAGLNGASGTNYIGTSGIMYQDSPSTTSATTYKVQISSEGNNAIAYINRPNSSSVPSSTITLMEIAG